MKYVLHGLTLGLFIGGFSGLSGCKPWKQSPQAAPLSRTQSSESKASGTPVHLSPEDEVLWQQANQFFKALPTQPYSPTSNPTTPEKVQLGKSLFHDPRLSKSESISCNSCHGLTSYGVDRRPTAIGHGLKIGERNTPTVLNTSLHFSQFWDGRAKNLETQAGGPILNPIEMGMENEAAIVERLRSIPDYKKAFETIFKDQDSVTYSNITLAIAAFERTLITPSPFDRYLAGDKNALSLEAKKGLQTYINYGCTACHNGRGIGGSLYQKFGVINPYEHQKDTGRFQVTHDIEDKYVFKVPSLRNVEKTAPYFHDGKVSDLEEAVIIMAKTQLDKDMPSKDAKKIIAFLKSLTGTLPQEALRAPTLPKN